MAKLSNSEIARRQQDVRLRSTLSDSQLTPDLLRKRLLARKLKQPVVPGSSETYGDLLRARKAASDLKYGDAVGSLQAQGPRDAGWFDQYVAAVKAAQTGQQAQSADVANQIKAFGDAGITASQALQGQTLAPLAAQAQVTGGSVDPSIAAIGDQASLVRQAMVNAFGANASANSLAQGDLLRAREQAGIQSKIEHGADLSNKLTALQKEKGAFQGQFTTDYLDAARQAVLEDQAFGLKQDQAAADLANTEADNARADAAEARAAAADRRAAAKDAYQREHGLGAYKPPAPPKSGWQSKEKQGVARSDLETARDIARDLKKYGRATVARWLTQGQKGQPLYDEFKDKNGKVSERRRLNPDGSPASSRSIPKTNAAVASAALDLIFNQGGKLSPYTKKKLHDAGYRLDLLGLA